MAKKVLIITYYWPPAGGPGVQRIVKFTKILPDFNWQPIILTVDNPTSPARDESLLKDIPKSCKIIKTTTFEPFRIYRYFTGKSKSDTISKNTIIKSPNEKYSEKISRIIRGNLFLPDARVGWIPAMIKNGLQIIKNEKPAIIFSTSPPHSLQLGAKNLAKKTGIKWIADFRDPWIEAYWEKEVERINLSNRINRKLEQSILKNADIITTVSDGICDLFKKKEDKQYETIFTGMDFVNTDAVKSAYFQIIYLGNMSKYQSPDTILKAIDQLPNKNKSLVKLLIIGNVYTGHVDRLKGYRSIHTEIRDFLPRDKMIELAKSASLLLLINLSTVYGKGLMTVKIFDYLSLRKPILAIGDKNSSLEQLLIDTRSGRLFSSDEIKNISIFINEKMSEWNNNPAVLLKDSPLLNKYRTRENVAKLVRLFEQLSEQTASLKS